MKKGRRVHIFWQRRINEGDLTTPYWYPCQTSSGAIREDRLVFPIPPGTHWTEVEAVEVARATRPCLPVERKKTGKSTGGSRGSPVPQKQTLLTTAGRRLRFGPPPPSPDAPKPQREVEKPKTPRVKTPRIDPQLVAKSRELRDRYLERVNTSQRLVLPAGGKYDVSRVLGGPHAPRGPRGPRPEPGTLLLPAA